MGSCRYADSDIYWAHAALNQQDKTSVTVVTSKRVLMLEKCRFWSDWDVEWEVLLSEIIAPPAVSKNRLLFKVRTVSTKNNELILLEEICI